jgi:hypothetical protein
MHSPRPASTPLETSYDLFEAKQIAILGKQERANRRRQEHEERLAREAEELQQMTEECRQLQEALDWQHQVERKTRHEARLVSIRSCIFRLFQICPAGNEN